MLRGPVVVLALLSLIGGATVSRAATRTISWAPYPDEVMVSGFRIYYKLTRIDRERARNGHLDVDASRTKVQVELPQHSKPYLLHVKVVALHSDSCESVGEWKSYEVDPNAAAGPASAGLLLDPLDVDFREEPAAE